ncbi:aliphatic sulfonate ABC transporter substrate-binding protein [Acinetobacter lwoffii]|uniref:aliphatic sulfonate ABC transporter substrate-binding protein n=1 Tax=Acinetobacter lwoffii TaxID=28090 RepID=UPI002097DCBA|nr:aliphatic sulfonate ABC transporter substrate-binding protein [Acinetobacter lwoffii]MCO8071052.1 aliphatic sulfonate ABC transporter substrate-binding protein [Acinetobacter lwoffii]
MSHLKTVSYISLALLSFSLTGCQKQEAQQKTAADTKATQPVKTIAIGFQKSALNLLVARDEKLLEQQFPNAKIEWKEFPAGPQMLEALAVGAVDYGYVGNTPPIFAQAADKALSYVAFEKVAGNSLAVVVPKDSAIQNIQQLKGKRIAVQKGSSAHELLAKTLEKAGLSWSEIQAIWLPPADARAAFDKKAIDAWAIWDPFLGAAEFDSKVKVLIESSDFPQTYSFYIGNPEFIQKHPDSPGKFIQALNASDQWILKNQAVALDIYQKSTGLKPEVAKIAFERRLKPSPVQPLTTEVIKAQQNIADLFQQVQLIPKTISVQQQIWSPAATH